MIHLGMLARTGFAPPSSGDEDGIAGLAVEVISPNEFFEEVLVKMHEYFAKGVRQVWIVVPGVEQVFVFDSPKQVQVFNGTDELQGGSLLPGLRLPVARLFKR
jgi:Uma2 family endonuclease